MTGDKKRQRVYTPRKITLGTAIGYGISDFVGGGSMTIVGAWMLFFYTTYCGLTAVQGALIISAARIVDAFTTLIMGSLTDNFYKTKLGKRFGRRHFFLYIGAPLLLIYAVLWISGMNFAYYLVTYLAFEVILSGVLIPYETLPTEMTDDCNARTKMSTARMFVSAGATFLATFLPGQLFKILGQNTAAPFLINGTIFAVIFAACVLITALTTWEKPVEEIANIQKEKTSVREILHDYISTFHLKSFRKHIAIYLFSFTGKDTFNTVFAYFCTFSLGVSATVAANMLSLSVVGLVVTLVAGGLMVKFGPKFLYVFAYSLMLCMLCCYYAVFKIQPEHHIVIVLFFISLVYQIGRAILEFTPWNVFPFIPDLDELVSGKKRAGIYAAVMTFGRKSTVALATMATGFILDMSGFVEGAHSQTDAVQQAIALILLFGTGTLVLIALLTALTFKLNKKSHQVIVDEINRLKAGGKKEDATEATKYVVKQLTGIDYEKVWPQS